MPKLAFDVKVWPELNRLLDAALDLPAAERVRWLASLPPEHEAMKPHLVTLLIEEFRERRRRRRIPPARPTRRRADRSLRAGAPATERRNPVGGPCAPGARVFGLP